MQVKKFVKCKNKPLNNLAVTQARALFIARAPSLSVDLAQSLAIVLTVVLAKFNYLPIYNLAGSFSSETQFVNLIIAR